MRRCAATFAAALAALARSDRRGTRSESARLFGCAGETAVRMVMPGIRITRRM
jgi:hypothetical protein